MRIYTLGFAVLLIALSAGRATALPPETVADVLGNATCPVLALDPATGEPHVAYVNQGTLYHAWKAGAVWQSETVASNVFGDASLNRDGFDLQMLPGGRAAVLYFQLGQRKMMYAVRESGGWLADTLDTVAGSFMSGSLAVSPVTGEPTAAWGTRAVPGTPYEIKLARRSGGTWATQVLDTTSAPWRAVAVAVDLADRPRVAWARPRSDGRAARVLTCATATSPAGPFVIAAVDSELTGYFSLAVDPSDGEPRIAYGATAISFESTIRYAARDGVLGWQSTVVMPSSGFQPSPSLAFDAIGAPFIALTRYSPVAPNEVRGGDDPSLGQCLNFQTGTVCVTHRQGGAGTGAFELYDCLFPPVDSDAISGPRALATHVAGVVAVVQRGPANACAPFTLGFTLSTPFAGVGPGAGARVALAPVAPNPARMGAPLRVVFELARAAAVTIEVHDVAGGRVAERALGRLGPGPHTLDWAPAVSRAGVYWLSVRTDGARLGTRSAVFVR